MANIRILNLSSYTAPEIKEVPNKEWVEYGGGNNYFQYLIDRYNGSPTNNAIINGIIELMYGKGLSATNASKKPDEYAQMKAIFKKDTIRRLVSDYKMMGQCAFQVVYNDLHDTIVQVEHFPIETLRAEKCNEEGDIEAYYYASDWQAVANNKEVPLRIPAFGKSQEGVEIMYVKPYRAGYYYYAPVDYQGGLQYAELEEEISNYHLNNIKNGMSPSLLLNFNNGVPDEEEQVLLENRITEKFTGSSNSGRFILAFNDNKELAATVEAIQLNDAASQYQFLSDEAREKLMVAHRVTSPMLLGIKDKTGLGNNADELITASHLFENIVIEPLQNVVLDAISEILNFNDITLDIYFKTLQPLAIDDVEVVNSGEAEKETGISLDSHSVPELTKEISERLFNTLSASGEVISPDEYELVDERPVDYDKEKIYDALWTFASVIESTPNQKSEQDTSVIKVRYKYTEGSENTGSSRDFCNKMMSANRVYRYEDIINAGAVNPGFGPNGSSTYDIWLYKGGPWCKHFWLRQTYLRKNNERISVNDAKRLIDRLDPSLRKEADIEPNPKQVAEAPRYMPDNGYLNPPWK